MLSKYSCNAWVQSVHCEDEDLSLSIIDEGGFLRVSGCCSYWFLFSAHAVRCVCLWRRRGGGQQQPGDHRLHQAEGWTCDAQEGFDSAVNWEATLVSPVLLLSTWCYPVFFVFSGHPLFMSQFPQWFSWSPFPLVSLVVSPFSFLDSLFCHLSSLNLFFLCSFPSFCWFLILYCSFLVLAAWFGFCWCFYIFHTSLRSNGFSAHRICLLFFHSHINANTFTLKWWGYCFLWGILFVPLFSVFL